MSSSVLIVLVTGMLLTLPIMPVGAAPPSSTHAAHSRPFSLSLVGPMTEKSYLDIVVEGAPPPSRDGLPVFGVLVRLNGWANKIPTPTYDVEKRAWTARWFIPGGQEGAIVTVIVVTADDEVRNSFSIRPA